MRSLLLITLLICLNLQAQRSAGDWILSGDQKTASSDFKKNNYASAAEDYSKAIALQPPSDMLATAHLKRGKILLYHTFKAGTKDAEAALKDADEAVRLAPGNPEAYKLRVDANLSLNMRNALSFPLDVKKLESDYEMIFKLKPEDAEALWSRADFKRRHQGDLKGAIEDLEKFAAFKNQDLSRAMCVIAEIKAWSLGDYAGAMEACDKGVSGAQGTAPGYLCRARLKMQPGNDFKGALVDFDLAIQSEPDTLNRLYYLQEKALVCNKINKKIKEREAWDEMIRLTRGKKEFDQEPLIVRAYVERAKFNLKDGNYPAALEELEKAALHSKTADPDQTGPIFREKARLRYQNKEYAAALGELELADKADYEGSLSDTAIRLMKVRCHLHLGNYKAALKETNFILNKLDPYDSTAIYYRGTARYFLKDYLKSAEDLSAAAIRQPRNADLFYIRGLDQLMLKKNKEAEDDFNRAIERDPSHAEAYYQRAGLLHKKGDKEGCCRDLTKANELGLQVAKQNLEKYCR